MKRLTFGALTAVVAAILLAPSSVLATSGFHTKVLANDCIPANGVYLDFKAKAVADGSTSANQLVVYVWTEKMVNGSWQQIDGSIGREQKSFTANGKDHQLVVEKEIKVKNSTPHRIVFQFQAWHNRTKLWGTKIHSGSCQNGS